MRASYLIWIPVALVCGCGSSKTTTQSSNDGGGFDIPDARTMFMDSGARELRPVGAACDSSNDCKDAFCGSEMFGGFTNGYCLAFCGAGMGPGGGGGGGTPTSCPANSACTSLDTQDGICYATCQSDSDCRVSDGYFCLDATPHVSAGGPKVCYPKNSLPSCNLDSDCPTMLPKCTGGTPPTGDAGGGGRGGFPTGTCGM